MVKILFFFNTGLNLIQDLLKKNKKKKKKKKKKTKHILWRGGAITGFTGAIL